MGIAIAECLGCGCTDTHACAAGCWWTEVDRGQRVGVCSECNPTHQVRVFAINDCEWWAGACTPEEILAAYIAETGCTHEEATGDESELPEELTLLQMHQLEFKSDGHKLLDVPKTFIDELNRLVKAGAKFPCSFACIDQ